MWDGGIIISEIRELSDGLCAFCNENNLWGYIDSKGTIVIPPQYIEAGDFHDGIAKVKKLDSKSFIYIDKKNNILTKKGCKALTDFKYGIGQIKKNGLFGSESYYFIDTEGKLTKSGENYTLYKPKIYKRDSDCVYVKYYIKNEDGTKEKIFSFDFESDSDTYGNIYACDSDEIIYKGLILFKFGKYNKVLVDESGYILASSKNIYRIGKNLYFIHNFCTSYDDNLILYDFNGNNWYIKGKWKINYVIKAGCAYPLVAHFVTDNVLLVRIENNKNALVFPYISSPVITRTYESIEFKEDTNCFICSYRENDETIYVALNMNGEEIECTRSVKPLYNYTKFDGKNYFITTKIEENHETNCEYEYTRYFIKNEDGNIIASYPNKDEKSEFSSINCYCESSVMVAKSNFKNTYAIINFNNLKNPKYIECDNITYKNGFFIVERDGLYGLFDKNGNVIFDINAFRIEFLDENTIFVSSNVYYFINIDRSDKFNTNEKNSRAFNSFLKQIKDGKDFLIYNLEDHYEIQNCLLIEKKKHFIQISEDELFEKMHVHECAEYYTDENFNDYFFMISPYYFRIRPEYLDILEYLDLSSFSFMNVDVRGVNFLGTNAKIDPKYVFSHRLDGCSLSPDNCDISNYIDDETDELYVNKLFARDCSVSEDETLGAKYYDCIDGEYKEVSYQTIKLKKSRS